MMFRSAAFACALLAAAPAAAQGLSVSSPDGTNTVTIGVGTSGAPLYSVSRRGEQVLAPSEIVIDLDSGQLGHGMAIAGSDTAAADRRYPIVAGKTAEGRDHHNQLTVHFIESGGKKRRLDLVVRAYDDGIAFRTIIPVQAETAAAIVRSERTDFRFPANHKCWGFNVGKFGSSHEGEFDPVDTTRMREHNLFDLPFLCETGKVAFALTEADLRDFAGMYLTGRGDGRLGLQSRLSPALDNGGVAVRTRTGTPIRTPWRVVMLADHAGELLESNLVTTLAAPSRIADTSWIKPGKSAWDWWNGTKIARIANSGTNTETAKAYIDFAADNGFEYSLVDDGWYVGSGRAPLILPGTDATRPTDVFDLDAVVAHAKARSVGVWLWVHWEAIDPQMEEALAYYASKGVVGIKVDFMDRDDQWMVRWYEKLFEAAARHRLMVNLHGAFVPRGLHHTWPNFVTQEGIMGAEYSKWSRRVTARHDVMLAYTRAMIGPSDYTPGGFRNVAPGDFAPRNDYPFVQHTRAHALSMYVVYTTPVAMVSDSPDTYAASPAGLEFVREVPTTWDETRFIAGEVGEWIAVARRKGRDWYVAAMNGDAARSVRLPLDFLGVRRFAATVWSDGAAPDAVVKSERAVGAGDALELELAATGGAVAVLRAR